MVAPKAPTQTLAKEVTMLAPASTTPSTAHTSEVAMLAPANTTPSTDDAGQLDSTSYVRDQLLPVGPQDAARPEGCATSLNASRHYDLPNVHDGKPPGTCTTQVPISRLRLCRMLIARSAGPTPVSS